MSRLLKNVKGQGVIFALVVMVVMILVGIIIINALVTSIGTAGKSGWTTEANNTWIATQANLWLAFGLVVIGIIIMGAVAILGILRGGFGGGIR